MLLTDDRFDQINLEGGALSYWPHFFSEEIADIHLNALLNDETEWRQEDILIYGKRHPQPRLIAWYGDPGQIYTYSRLKLTPNPWTSRLLDIRHAVEKVAGASFNSVLLNLYRTGQDSIAWHADNEPELGNTPTIASISFGATRKFRFRNRATKEIRALSLTHGSLLVMKGSIQQFWVHDIPKEKGIEKPRINLTFRLVIPTT